MHGNELFQQSPTLGTNGLKTIFISKTKKNNDKILFFKRNEQRQKKTKKRQKKKKHQKITKKIINK
jgi:hypothetical protein